MIPALGRERQSDHWGSLTGYPASLANSRLVRDPVAKKKGWNGTRGITAEADFWFAHMYTHTYTYTTKTHNIHTDFGDFSSLLLWHYWRLGDVWPFCSLIQLTVALLLGV